jgi:hypothetical protein
VWDDNCSEQYTGHTGRFREILPVITKEIFSDDGWKDHCISGSVARKSCYLGGKTSPPGSAGLPRHFPGTSQGLPRHFPGTSQALPNSIVASCTQCSLAGPRGIIIHIVKNQFMLFASLPQCRVTSTVAAVFSARRDALGCATPRYLLNEHILHFKEAFWTGCVGHL